jgi:tetratricopeptide (TPR) repeat protein
MLRVNARLVDIASGQQLWAGSYDRAGADLFAVEDEIATAVTDALQLVLSPEEAARVTHAQTTELSAYDAFLLGQSRVATRDGEALVESADYYRQAIRIDPGYALAHAALAEALYLATVYSGDRVGWHDVANEARAAANQAQALDPSLGESYLAQALVAKGDNESGNGSAWSDEHIRALLKRAVELSPNNAIALKFYSDFATSIQDGLVVLRRAAQLDPRSAIVRQNIGDGLAASGDYVGALDAYLQAAQMVKPYFQPSRTVIPLMLQFQAKEADQAARWARAFYQADPDRDSALPYVRALLGLGVWAEAQQVIGELAGQPMADDDLIMLRMRAVLGVARNDCGEVGRALAALKRLVQPGTWSLQGAAPAPIMLEPILLAQSLCEIRVGRADQALQLLESAMPELMEMQDSNVSALALRTPVLLAALDKSNGQIEPARRALEDFLETVRESPTNGFGGLGFARFLALAVQGETAASLAELEAVAATGWTEDWWLLEALNFDPDVAAVTEDPRYQAINARLQERVRQMREDYLAKPELPEDLLRRAGLKK